jgi:hypothetical protein
MKEEQLKVLQDIKKSLWEKARPDTVELTQYLAISEAIKELTAPKEQVTVRKEPDPPPKPTLKDVVHELKSKYRGDHLGLCREVEKRLGFWPLYEDVLFFVENADTLHKTGEMKCSHQFVQLLTIASSVTFFLTSQRRTKLR